MTNADPVEQSAIQGNRFLLINSNKADLEKLERYLLMDAAAKVYKAKSPLLALRILQDRRTPVDCVICAQDMSPITGLDFLQNLRTGRYGAKSLRETNVVLTMKQKDTAVTHAADSFLVSGYIFGEVTRDGVSETLNKILTKKSADAEQADVCRIAHVRESGVDLILVPFESDFGDLPDEEKEKAVTAIRKTAVLAGLKGEVVPIWPTEDDGTSFMAPRSCHEVVKNITFDFVRINLNRQFTPVGFPESAIAALPIEDKKKKLEKELSKKKSAPSKHTSLLSGSGPQKTGDMRQKPSSPFSEVHVRKVMAAFKQLGPEKFVKAFVRGQPIVRDGGKKNFDTLMSEYYVSVERLRKPLFADADMRGCGLIFYDLTMLLDQIVLRSFEHLPINGGQFSLNLNVKSVFTKTFEHFLANAPVDQLVIEFRQPDIIEYFDEYEVARGLILGRGAKIAVDQIVPDKLGLVHLEYLGASIAKFQWSKDGNDTLKGRGDALKRMASHDIEAIMTRVDDSRAIDMAAELGVQKFQGFLIDDMIQQQTH